MHNRIFKSIGIVAVVAVTAVPSALATRVVDVSGGTGVMQTPLVQTKVVRPDDRAGARTSEPATVVATTSTGKGFNWGDAGIGAGSTIGLFLLLSLGAIATHRNRKGPLTA